MSQNRFWNLLAKKLSGEAMPSDLTELGKLVRENPEWVYSAEHVEKIWNLQPKEQDASDAEIAFAQHLELQKKNGLDLLGIDTPAHIEELTDSPISRNTSKLGSF